MRLVNIAKTTILLSAVALATACTTSGKKKDSTEAFDAMNMKANNPDHVIVHQPNRSKAVVSKYDRKHWVKIRKQTKAGHKRLYATLATGSWDAAEQDARRYLMANPRDKVALTVLALSLSMQKKFTLGAYYAKLYERYHGESADSLNLRALALVTSTKGKMSDYRKAVNLFYQAFSQNPEEIASGLNLGQLYLEIGDAAKAANTYAEVKSRCNSCIGALIGEGVAQIRMRKYQAAKKNFESVLDIEEYHPQALYRLAQIAYYGDKDFETAKDYLDTLKVRVPEREYLIKQKGLALVRTLDEIEEEEYIAERKADRKSRSRKLKRAKMQDDPNSDLSDEILETGLTE